MAATGEGKHVIEVTVAGEFTVATDFRFVVSVTLGGRGTRFTLRTKEPVGLKQLIEEIAKGFGFKVPDFGKLWNPINGLYLMPSVSVLPSYQGSSGRNTVQGAIDIVKQQLGPDGRPVPAPWTLEFLGVPILRLHGINLSLQQGRFDFGADVEILERRQIVEYPMPTPAPQPPLIQLNYFGIGQRLQVPVAKDETSISRIIAQIRNDLKPIKGDDVSSALAKYYRSDGGWLVALDMSVRNTFALQILFNDPVLYGLAISVQAEWAKGLEFEILYKKISDDVGLYYIDLTLPIVYRTFDVGSVTITLPSIAISIYTNGDFKVSIGWPLGERSLTIQVFPFLGSGGFYFARLSSATATNVPTDHTYDPVLEFGIALSIGVGKKFNKGILVAEISVSLYGIFEGRLAWIKREARALTDQRTSGSRAVAAADGGGALGKEPDWFWFQGTFGIIGVVQGVVNFAIIKATLTVRIEASVTVTFEKGKPTPITVHASVDVSLKVEIGGFKIFGVRIAITIHLSFHAEITQTFVIDNSGKGAALFAAAVPPMAVAWDTAIDLVATADERRTIPLYLMPQIALLDGKAQFVATLMIRTKPAKSSHDGAVADFALVVAELTKWAIVASKQVEIPAGGVGEAVLDFANLTRLLACLNQVEHLNAKGQAGQSPVPMDYAKIVVQLAKAFLFELAVLTDDDADEGSGGVEGAVFPMFPDVIATITGQAGGDPAPIDFGDAARFGKTETYRNNLADYFEELLIAFQSADEAAAAFFIEEQGIPMATIVFEDYAALLIKGAAEAMLTMVTDPNLPPDPNDKKPEVITVNEALGKLDINQLAAKASRFMQHGLRLPKNDIPSDRSAWPALALDALYIMTGQQFAVAPSTDAAYEIALSVKAGAAAYLTTSATAAPIYRIAKDDTAARQAIADLETIKVPLPTAPPDPVVGLAKRPLTFTLKNTVNYDAYAPELTEKQLVAISGPMNALATAEAAKNTPLTISLSVSGGGDGTGEPVENFQPAILVKLTITRLQPPRDSAVSREGTAGRFIPHIYQLGGATEANRKLLNLYLTSPEGESGNPAPIIDLLYPNTEAGRGVISRPLDERVILVKTNLSTLSNPPGGQTFAAILAGDEPPFTGPSAAGLTTPEARKEFLRLVWQLSIVNSGGFFLYYQVEGSDDDPLTDLFETSDSADFYMMVRFGGDQSIVRPYHNILVADRPATNGDVSGATYHAEARGLFEYDAAVPAGSVGFRLTRDNPNVGLKLPPSLQTLPAKTSGLTREEVAGALQNNGIQSDSPDFERLMDEAGDTAAQVANLFNLLQYRIGSAGAFDLSVWGIPVGPSDPTDNPQAATERRARAAAGGAAPEPEPAQWVYHQSLAVYRSAKANDGKPVAEMNRYAGVGDTVTLTFRLLDIFGNVLSDKGAAGTASAWNTLPIPLSYWDRLLPIDAWPGVSLTYDFAPASGGVSVVVTLVYNPDAVVPSGGAGGDETQTAAQAALIAYGRVYDQVRDDTVTATFAISAAEGQSFDADDKKQPIKAELTTFVDAIRGHLKGTAPKPPGPLALSFTITDAILDKDTRNLFTLDAEFQFSRTKYVDPETKAKNPDAAAATTIVPPNMPPADANATGQTGGKASPHGITAFAIRFETAFAGRFKLATGRADPASKSAQNASDNISLWAVRLGRGGITVAADPVTVAGHNTLYYFAPEPLSTSLQSDTFKVRAYKSPDQWTGGTDDYQLVEQGFADKDLDAMARSFLDAFDAFLDPALAVPAAQLLEEANLPGLSYFDILNYKWDIAGALAARVVPVFADQPANDDAAAKPDLDQAQEEFRQRLLSALGAAYEVSTIVQVPVTVTVPHPASGKPPKLYGKIIVPDAKPATGAQDNDENRVSFSVAKLSLENGDGTFSFLFLPSQPKAQSAYTTALTYRVGFLEHDFDASRQTDSDAKDYLESSWLRFVLPDLPDGTPDPRLALTIDPVSIPVPLREFPAMPTLQEQSADPAPNPTTPKDAAKWTYRLTYHRERVSQDLLQSTVSYNLAVPDPSITTFAALIEDDDPATLFEALARFVYEYPVVSDAFTAIPKAVGADTKKEDKTIALAAIERFTRLARGVALTLRPQPEQAFAALAGGPPRIDDEYWYKDEPAGQNGGQPKILVYRFHEKVRGASIDGWPNWPIIAGFKRTGTRQPDKTIEAEHQIAVYTKNGDGPPQADVAERNIAFINMNPMLRQNGNTEVLIKRNVLLSPDRRTNPAFVYETPSISFPTPVTPLIDVGAALPIKPPQYPGKGFRARFAAFLKDLFTAPGAGFVRGSKSLAEARVGAEQQTRLIKLATGYRFALVQTDAKQALTSRMPLLLTDNYSFKVPNGSDDGDCDLNAPGSFVNQLGEVLARWYEANRPLTTGASVTLELTVFSNFSEEKLPLIHFRELQVMVDGDGPEWWTTTD